MKISMNDAPAGQIARWADREVSHHELSEIWSSSAKVSAQQKADALGRNSVFVEASALMVRIDLARLPLEVAMDAYFTQQYGSVAAWGRSHLGDELLLAFELPTQVTNKRTLDLLVQGLEVIFAGARHQNDVLAQYGLDSVTNTRVIGRQLDMSAVTMLEQLGHETRLHKNPDGAFMRSRHRLHRSMSVLLASGESLDIECVFQRSWTPVSG